MEVRVAQGEVLFEGLREEEILSLPKEDVEQLILLGDPIVFRVGWLFQNLQRPAGGGACSN